MSGSHASTRFARRLKANGLSPFHNSSHWHLSPSSTEKVAPIDPQLLVLEPQIDQQDLRTAHRKQPRIIPRSESLRGMKPPRRQGIVISIVSRDRGDAEVRRAVVEVAVVEGSQGRGRG